MISLDIVATCGWILYSKIPDSHRPAGHFYLYGKKVDHHFYRVTEGSLSHWMSHFFLGEAHQTSHFCFPLENEMPFNFQIHSTLSSNLQNIQNFKKTFLIKLRPMSIIYIILCILNVHFETTTWTFIRDFLYSTPKFGWTHWCKTLLWCFHNVTKTSQNNGDKALSSTSKTTCNDKSQALP